MNSIFDTTNRSDHTKSLAFLDPHGGVTLQRYEKMKYPQFDKLTDRQLGFFWRPQEIDIVRDSKDFRDLTPHEQHIFSSNLKRQILLDSVQGRSPSIALLPIASLPEVEAWITVWSLVEMIHSRSYTHIIQNVYNDPSVPFDTMMDVPEIVECALDVSKYYDHLIELSMRYRLNQRNDLRVLKHALWMTIMSINILEGVRFYVSFACSWAFAETKRMEGNAKIIKLICMSDDHEILTNQGWKRFADLSRHEKVAQYTSDGTVEFVAPIAYIEEDFDGEMVKFKTETVDALYTPDHRVIYKENGFIKESRAADFNPSCAKSYIVAGRKVSGRDELTDIERLRIAVQADGHISDRYTGEICGHIPITFHLKKDRKIDRLLSMLDRLQVERITYSLRRRDNGFADITVNVPTTLAMTKDFNWINVEVVSSIWADAFFEELSKWDGHVRPDAAEDGIYYSSISPECVDVVQALAVISNRKQHRGLQEDHRKDTYSDVHRLYTQPGTERCCGIKAKTKSSEPYQGKVYCVTVPSGMIVVRRNKSVYVTGNCRDENLHLAFTQLLLKILPQDDPDFVTIAEDTREECTRCYLEAAQQEKAWAHYLFKDGSMIGLNEELLSQYVEYIAHKRMTAVGLPSPFKQRANPLPWTQKWISGSEVQTAPQESEIVTYTMGDIKQDLTENIFKDITL